MTESMEAMTQRIAQEIIDTVDRRRAEDDARRARPVNRFIRAWRVLIGTDQDPGRRFR